MAPALKIQPGSKEVRQANNLPDLDFNNLPELSFGEEKAPSIMERVFDIPSAAVRSFLRGKGYANGAVNFRNEESFQNEALRKFNDSLDKTPVKDLPEGAQTLTRFLAGAPISAAGVAADLATNPGDVLATILGEKAASEAGKLVVRGNRLGSLANAPIESIPRSLARGAEETPGAFERLQAMRVKEKGQKRVAELLRPSGKEYNEALSSRNVPGELKEGFNVIQETEKPKQLVQMFDDEIGKVMGFRDKLIQQNNQPISPKAIATQARYQLEKTYGKGLSQLSREERPKVMKLFKREIQTLVDQGELDTVKAQARKEFLQNETKGLLNKKSRGETVILDPQEQVVKDAFRFALRNEIERAHPDIATLNSRFDGLDNAKDWAAKIHADALNEPSDFMRRLTQILGRPNTRGRVAAAVREVPSLKNTLKTDTGKIAKLRGEYEGLMEKSRALSKKAPDVGNLEYTPEERLLLAPTDAYLKRLMGPERLKELAAGYREETLALPKGQGFELVDAEESAGRQRLQKFREDMSQDLDIGPKRSSMKYLSAPEKASREASQDRTSPRLSLRERLKREGK